MVPLTMAVALFLAYAWLPYLSLDPEQSRLTNLQRESFPPHYAFIVIHMVFGTIAMIGVCLQIWPWLRSRSLRAHRWIGRVTVYGGVIPGALTAFVLVPFSPGAPGDAVAATLWLATTAYAVWLARRNRFADHRRFMIYCLALTTQIIWGRIWIHVLKLFPFWSPEVFQTLLETQAWLGFVINLLIAQWYLDRPRRKVSHTRTKSAPTP